MSSVINEPVLQVPEISDLMCCLQTSQLHVFDNELSKICKKWNMSRFFRDLCSKWVSLHFFFAFLSRVSVTLSEAGDNHAHGLGLGAKPPVSTAALPATLPDCRWRRENVIMNAKPWAPARAPETLGGREVVAEHTGISVSWKHFHALSSLGSSGERSCRARTLTGTASSLVGEATCLKNRE